MIATTHLGKVSIEETLGIIVHSKLKLEPFNSALRAKLLSCTNSLAITWLELHFFSHILTFCEAQFHLEKNFKIENFCNLQ